MKNQQKKLNEQEKENLSTKDSYDNHMMNLNKDLPLNEEKKNVDKKEMRKTKMNHY